MSSSRPSTSDGKATVVAVGKTKGGFFSRRKGEKADNDEKIADDTDPGVKPAEAEKVPPVSFTEMFRYVGTTITGISCF